MDASRIIPSHLLTLEQPPAPEPLDHAEYIRCCAGSAANFWLLRSGIEWSTRQWKRLTYAVACFGNLKLAETADSVDAMDAAAPKMMACAIAIQEAKR